MTSIEQVKEKGTICDECGMPMRLQGVGSYFEEGKEPRGTMYYFCCKKWKILFLHSGVKTLKRAKITINISRFFTTHLASCTHQFLLDF